MERRLVPALVAVLVLGLVVGFAAKAMAQDDGSSTQKPVRTISVTSTATVKTAPDEAVLTLGVRSESPESASAMSTNAKDMQAVLNALEAAGLDKKDIQTLSLRLEQQTLKSGKPGEHRVYVASNQIQVTIHDLSAVGSVIDAAVQAGADSVGNISFQLANPNQVRTDALKEAVRGARAKADALAEAAGTNVVRVVTIDEQTYREPVYHYAFDQAALAVPAAAPTPVVPPDTLQASVTVSVVWEIA
jgi:uncharacterized protein YggE